MSPRKIKSLCGTRNRRIPRTNRTGEVDLTRRRVRRTRVDLESIGDPETNLPRMSPSGRSGLDSLPGSEIIRDGVVENVVKV